MSIPLPNEHEAVVLSSVERLKYFFGQLLTQRDLEAEQRYHLMLQRLMQREAFGTGTVTGLKVEAAGDESPKGVVIRAGLAVDPGGRELLLENDVCLELVPAGATPSSHPFDPTPQDAEELAAAVETRFQAPFAELDLDFLVNRFAAVGRMSAAERDAYFGSGDIGVVGPLLERIPPTPVPQLTPPEILRDWLFDQLVGTLHVGLRYREAGSEPSPAVLDGSCCGTATCFFSRTREGITVVTSSTAFPPPFDPYAKTKLCLDAAFFDQMKANPSSPQVDCHAALCHCLLDGGFRGVPSAGDGCGEPDLPVVPLATVHYDPFQKSGSQVLGIDNCTVRPLAPGGPAIRALLESLTGCARPDALAPRFVAVEPVEGASVPVSVTEDSFTLRARANAIVVLDGTNAGWELVHYPTLGSVEVFTQASPPAGYNATFQASGKDVQLALEGVGATLPPGTYVWRIINGETAAADPMIVEAEAAPDGNGQQLDGEPNPPAAVPSGNGKSGGAFSVRFVVTP